MSDQKSTEVIDDKKSIMEIILFSDRPLFLFLFSIMTLFLLVNALLIKPEASFLSMIPSEHEYIQNYIEHEDDLKGLGNALRIAVEAPSGDIYNADYLETLRSISDDVFFIPGVDRSALKSLWSPNVRWNEVTEFGFDFGSVIDENYNGSDASLQIVRRNIQKSGEVGSLVANDHSSSVIYVPLLDVDPKTLKPLNYQKLSADLEEVRSRYAELGYTLHIVGFAKVVGDLIDGAGEVFSFFGIAFLVLLAFLYWSSRCLRSTAVRAASSFVAVIWQLGFLSLFGYGLNPYSMLVPFLMFALGVSHGIQMGSTMTQEMIKGADKLLAARLAYRKVFKPGLAALVTDGIGFLTLIVISIAVIQDIAVGAAIGVAVVAFTDLMLLPVLLSYTGVSKSGLKRVNHEKNVSNHGVWRVLSNLATPKAARISVTTAALLLVLGFWGASGLKVGDLDSGAPELRPDSRYNLDDAYMNEKYSASSDLFVIMLRTPAEGNSDYSTLTNVDQLEWELQQLSGVQSTISLVSQVKLLNVAFNEGKFDWYSIPRSQVALDSMIAANMPAALANTEGTLSPILVFLNDHKAETLSAVVAVAERFAATHNNAEAEFLLAAGNAGIEAATNMVIESAHLQITYMVYSVVLLICVLTYRSFLGAICVVAPLFLTTVLSEALMTWVGIGIKVATLPVIAVGVGIGVDYGIYIFNRLSQYLRRGQDLKTAYYNTLRTSGRAVLFTGTTLSIGVATWIFSPIKFQADMGLLLTFMFLVNMIGAILLIPGLMSLLGVAKRMQPKPEDKQSESAVTKREKTEEVQGALCTQA
jgi:predicted RND superfamily exporter protein